MRTYYTVNFAFKESKTVTKDVIEVVNSDLILMIKTNVQAC